MARQWQMVVVAAVAVCGRAEAEGVRASFAVSATVVDQCIVRPDLRSATCTGGAGYAVGVAHETIGLPTRGQSIGVGDDAHGSWHGPSIAAFPSAAGRSAAAGQDVGLAGVADRAVAPGQIDALRITFSF